MRLYNSVLRREVTPGGEAYKLYIDMLEQSHMLIAGATGSGKSVVMNGLIATIMLSASGEKALILIDPKRVEFSRYRWLPHTLAYAQTPSEIEATLHYAIDLIEQRFQRMEHHGLQKSLDGDIYILIDEFADLMVPQQRATLPLIIRIAKLGRAANIHLFLATQRPTRDIITGQIKVNMDARLALRVPTSQDSRNIIDVNGAEFLPRWGEGYYLTPETMRPLHVEEPMVTGDVIQHRLNHWHAQTGVSEHHTRRWWNRRKRAEE